MWEMQSLQASRVLKSVSGIDFQWKETQTAATPSYCDFTAQQCWTALQIILQTNIALKVTTHFLGLESGWEVGKPGECDYNPTYNPTLLDALCERAPGNLFRKPH